MNRKYIIDFINNDILPQIDSCFTWTDIIPGKELIQLVIDFRKAQIKAGKARKGDTLTAIVDDGFLYINNTPVKRIAPKLPKVPYDEYSNYIEGKILAMFEID